MKKKALKNTQKNFSYWKRAISKFWKISGNYEKLNSEFDLNFEGNNKKNKKFIIKVMRDSCQKEFLEGQIDFLNFVSNSKSKFPIPKICKSKNGNDFEIIKDENNNERYVWVVKKIDGVLFSDFNPKTNGLIFNLGRKVASLDLFSKSFKKDLKIPDNKWNLTNPFWIEKHFSEISDFKIKN